MEETTPSRSGEWTKFIILVGIFLVVILVVWMTRSFIFDRVVSAVLGEGETTAIQVEEPAPVVDEEVDGSEQEAVDESVEEEAIEDADPAEDEPEEADPEPASESVGMVEHVVQPGETVYALSRKYNIAADAIIDLNNLTNPDKLDVGAKLLIPQPDDNN